MSCIVCGRGKSAKLDVKSRSLPSGARAFLCDGCDGDRFRVAEAERRVAAQVRG